MSLSFCTLASGSKGNSYVAVGRKSAVLVDAGLSAKYIACALNGIGLKPDMISGIVITHEHSDHIAGVRVFTKNFNIPIYANEPTMEKILKKFPDIPLKNLRTFSPGEDFFIGEMNIVPFKTPHDSVSSVGYSIYNGNSKITIATDIGHVTKTILNAAANSDVLVFEANHDLEMLQNGSYPERLKQRIQGKYGHLCNDICGKTLAMLLDENVRNIVLAHLSQENNTPQLAFDTVKERIEEKGARVGVDVEIEVSKQDARGKCYKIV